MAVWARGRRRRGPSKRQSGRMLRASQVGRRDGGTHRDETERREGLIMRWLKCKRCIPIQYGWRAAQGSVEQERIRGGRELEGRGGPPNVRPIILIEYDHLDPAPENTVPIAKTTILSGEIQPCLSNSNTSRRRRTSSIRRCKKGNPVGKRMHRDCTHGLEARRDAKRRGGGSRGDSVPSEWHETLSSGW